jgi:phage tail sheath protein FI
LQQGLSWTAGEQDNELLWGRVREQATSLLETLWRNGELAGVKAEEAFYVRCDRTTMTQNDIDAGRLIVVMGVAPVKPAEFVVIRIEQLLRARPWFCRLLARLRSKGG